MADDDDVKPRNTDDSKLRVSKSVTVAVKLNGMNYQLWARLMKIQIGSRRVLKHITGTPPPPALGAADFTDWEETNLIVFSWILDNIETDIMINFAHHQTAQALWESLAVTFESSADPYRLYNLEEKAGKITQGEQDLETYWRHLHETWIDVDRRQHQPIDCCDKGTGQFRRYSGTRRLFKFLTGLHPRNDSIKRDILKETPWPSTEVAYGMVKREAARLKIMPTTITDPTRCNQ